MVAPPSAMLTTPFIRHNLPQALRAEDERAAISAAAIAANGKINCAREWRTAVTPIGPSAADSPIRANVRLPHREAGDDAAEGGTVGDVPHGCLACLLFGATRALQRIPWLTDRSEL